MKGESSGLKRAWCPDDNAYVTIISYAVSFFALVLGIIWVASDFLTGW